MVRIVVPIENTHTENIPQGPLISPSLGKPHPLTNETVPVTMGHEFCGRVKQAPANSHLKVGQAVMVDPRLYCDSCTTCKTSDTNICESWGFRGLSGGGGGLSEAVAVDANMCYPLPDDAPLELAALIEPLVVAYHAVKTSKIETFVDKSVLILGGGPIGLAVIAILRSKGAKTILVSEPTAKRQKQNREFADAVFDPMKENIGDRCRELTHGKGVHIVFDCAGTQPGMDAGMDALMRKGIYLNIAAWQKPVSTSDSS
jgi:threonine dehydrogenase-like Zn-dependent dehydrogenase